MEVSPHAFSKLAPQHALARPRDPTSVLQSVTNKPKAVSSNVYAPPLDTSTLAAHDFDVDVRSGFMPPEPPISRLPPEWAAWEEILDDAVQSSPRLKVGDYADISAEETERSRRWRDSVQDVSKPRPFQFPFSTLAVTTIMEPFFMNRLMFLLLIRCPYYR
jgi:hypothetical protein